MAKITMVKMNPPLVISIDYSLKKALGCISKDPVYLGNYLLKIHDEALCYHDLYHLEISCLARIKMGHYEVSGIHGINLPIFHDSPIVAEYDYLLDEARVAFHECLTRTSVFNTIKLFLWMFWLITQGINPLSVLISHLRVLHKDMLCQHVENKINFGEQNVKILNENSKFKMPNCSPNLRKSRLLPLIFSKLETAANTNLLSQR